MDKKKKYNIESLQNESTICLYYQRLNNKLNYRNEYWDKKCLEIQSYLVCKKSSESWKFIKNIRS